VHPFFLASSGEAAVWFIFSLKGCAFLYLLIHKIRLYLLELLNQADAPKKFDQNRQAPKGSHCTQGVADFDLPTPKKRLKFLPIVLFRHLKGMFLHNSFSHKRLEQNEADLPRLKFGFWAKSRDGLTLDGYPGGAP
jgi:hypothetical protein